MSRYAVLTSITSSLPLMTYYLDAVVPGHVLWHVLAVTCEKGHGDAIAPKLPSCPQTNSFEKNFLTSFVPTECHKWVYKPKLSVRSARSNILCPLRLLHSNGAVNDCDG